MNIWDYGFQDRHAKQPEWLPNTMELRGDQDQNLWLKKTWKDEWKFENKNSNLEFEHSKYLFINMNWI